MSNSYTFQTYGYDTMGRKVDIMIKDDKSYLMDGQRIPLGYTVSDKGGGIWKLTESGGVKVTEHNRYIENTDKPNKYEENKDGYIDPDYIDGQYGVGLGNNSVVDKFLELITNTVQVDLSNPSENQISEEQWKKNVNKKWFHLTDKDGNVVGTLTDVLLGKTMEWGKNPDTGNYEFKTVDRLHSGGIDGNGNAGFKEDIAVEVDPDKLPDPGEVKNGLLKLGLWAGFALTIISIVKGMFKNTAKEYARKRAS